MGIPWQNDACQVINILCLPETAPIVTLSFNVRLHRKPGSFNARKFSRHVNVNGKKEYMLYLLMGDVRLKRRFRRLCCIKSIK